MWEPPRFTINIWLLSIRLAGCTVTKEYQVPVKASPAISITTSGNYVCSSDALDHKEVTLKAVSGTIAEGSTDGISNYTWFAGAQSVGTAEAPLATTQSVTVKHEDEHTSIYTVPGL